ncbi:Putative glutathione S-transferase, Thioredoxin-like superfamily, glutathione Transferase family [Septoria linicola]|uniref:Glutathione S-transferase, Thioredoxin-like superfamily, glutathione Transferase family n=1 Tax=Septoria linicola TaxID=215465 RepID=A0A9Q9B1E7_9PEZI|nr:putative glutathione S-transferase, Thioredoxin-like superfamily, glutathione Transferase family [Septoria linicola]USW55506.1 Putative glutathione S-transferase, Thioredoxin-like superfamily, glutathione Transferase family [Septoria linicola]
MANLTLRQAARSGNCYKVALTAALTGTKLDKVITYNTVEKETRTPSYLATINSNGKVPVLQIGENVFLPESNAAAYYLADGSDLIPTDRLQRAQMLQWMFFEQYTHEPAIARLRFMVGFKGLDNCTEEEKASVPGKRKAGGAALDVMEKHLSTRKFFVADKVTLADVALFGYTHVAHESGFFDLNDWPNVRDWCERVKGLPIYVPME